MISAGIIRTAALELHSLENKDVVKIAGIVRRIKNWWAAWNNPEYREQIQKLKDESVKLESILEALTSAIDSLQTSINDTDVETYGESLRRVRFFTAELAKELGTFDSTSAAAFQSAPYKEVSLDYVTKEMLQDKDVHERLQKQLPNGYDIPLGAVNKPVQDFNWMKQFAPDDIEIRPVPSENIKNKIATIISSILLISEDEAKTVVNSSWPELVANIKTAILNGTLMRAEHATVSSTVKQRTANEIALSISAYNINVPGTDILIDLPYVKLIDLSASGRPSKKLALYMAQARMSPRSKKANIYNELISLAASDHEWARGIIIEAFTQEMGRAPTLAEAQIVQAVSLLETRYGKGWRNKGDPKSLTSNNWGAVQCCLPKGGQCPQNTFLYEDSRPQPDGSSKKYAVCFKSYASPVEGARDVVRNLFKNKSRAPGMLQAAQTGSLTGVSEVMYDTTYYQGFGKTREDRIRGHLGALEKNINAISKTLNEPAQVRPDREVAPKSSDEKTMIATKPQEQPETMSEINKDYEDLINTLMAAAEQGPMEKLVRTALEKKLLPNSKVLVMVMGNDFPAKIRFANILSSALNEEISAETSIFHNGDDVEIECEAAGSEKAVTVAIQALSDGVSNAFNDATGFKIVCEAEVADRNDDYILLNSGTSEECFRKFAFEMIANDS